MYGGIFISSRLFYNEHSDPQFYFITISSIVLFLICCIHSAGFENLLDSIRSKFFCMALVYLSVLLSIHGMLQYLNVIPTSSMFRITGSFDNPAGYAVAQSVLFPFGVSVLLKKKLSIQGKIMPSLSILLSILTVCMSGMRTGILSFLVVLAVMILFSPNIVSFLKKNSWIIWMSFPLLLLVVVLLYCAKTDSVHGRILIWIISLNMIMEKTIFGFGIDGFRKYYMDYQADYFHHNSNSPYAYLADNTLHPFNEYIKLIIEHGVLGLMIAILIAGFIIRGVKRNGGSIYRVCLSLFMSLFVFCSFSYPYHYACVWYMTGYLVIAAVPYSFARFIHRHKRVRFTISGLLLLLLWNIICTMNTELKWTEISKRSLAGQTEEVIPCYRELKTQLQGNPFFLYNYAAELNYIGKYQESIIITKQCRRLLNDYDVQLLLADNLANIGEIENAIKVYNHITYMIPNRFLPLERMMELYIQEGDTSQAKSVASLIINKREKIPSKQVILTKKRAQEVLHL